MSIISAFFRYRFSPYITLEIFTALFFFFQAEDGIRDFCLSRGLGLPICKNIAEQLGGRIGVDSAVGAGSCFWVEIPAGK